MPTDTALHKAAHNGDLAAVKNLLHPNPESGEDPIPIDAPGAADRRPLHRAAGGNHVAVCTYLCEEGALIDERDKSGRTALHWSSISGHKESSVFLLEKGADIMACTTSKMTPLHGATEGGRVEIVKLLLDKAGAERRDELCNAKDEEGKTPCDLAVGGKHKAVVEILKKMGDPNAASAACVVM